MSNTQFAFIEKKNIPNREQLQNSINKLGFNFQLDTEYTPYQDEGYSPCILNGEEVGFEIFYDLSNNITENDESLKQIAKNNDYCISMSWGGDIKDCASVMIVSTALAKDFKATISYEGEEPQKLEAIVDNTKSILKKLPNKKIKKINIFNEFQKKAGTNLAEFLKPYGYKYNKKAKEFISYRNEIVFKIAFEKAGYGSRIELLYWAYIPLLGLTFDMSSDAGGYINGSITSFKWDIEEKSMQDIEKELNHYIEEIKEVFLNYIYILNSSKINTYNLDTQIKQEYENRYPCFYASDEYMDAFYEQGKTEEDWTKEDDDISKQLIEGEREKAHLFNPIKKDMIKQIDTYKLDYESIVSTHIEDGYQQIKVNEDVLPLELKTFLDNDIFGKKIVELLYEYNYRYIDDKDYRGGPIEVENFQNVEAPHKQVKIIVTEALFLEFEVFNGQDKKEIIASYNLSPFNFGWLIGSKQVREENTKIAMLELQKCLDGEYMSR